MPKKKTVVVVDVPEVTPEEEILADEPHDLGAEDDGIEDGTEGDDDGMAEFEAADGPGAGDGPDGPDGMTFRLDAAYGQGEEYEDEDEDEGFADDEEGFADESAAAIEQLTQLLMTDKGEPIADVLAGIRDALDKQNKILYRGLQRFL